MGKKFRVEITMKNKCCVEIEAESEEEALEVFDDMDASEFKEYDSLWNAESVEEIQ